jgi:hypothetical protein
MPVEAAETLQSQRLGFKLTQTVQHAPEKNGLFECRMTAHDDLKGSISIAEQQVCFLFRYMQYCFQQEALADVNRFFCVLRNFGLDREHLRIALRQPEEDRIAAVHPATTQTPPRQRTSFGARDDANAAIFPSVVRAGKAGSAAQIGEKFRIAPKPFPSPFDAVVIKKKTVILDTAPVFARRQESGLNKT